MDTNKLEALRTLIILAIGEIKEHTTNGIDLTFWEAIDDLIEVYFPDTCKDESFIKKAEQEARLIFEIFE